MEEMLIDNIRKQCGTDIAEKINKEVVPDSAICILYIADVKERTPDEVERECAGYKARYPERNVEHYKKLMRESGKDVFRYVIEPMGYFIDEETAKQYATKNVADMNEAGSFPYVILAKTPLNIIYPYVDTVENDKKLFHFDESIRGYKEIAWNTDKFTEFLLRCGRRGCF